MTICTQSLKITSEQLENAVEKLKVPLSRLHPDGMGGVVVGPERYSRKERLLIDIIAVQSEGCWTWRGAVLKKSGYGRVKICQKTYLAHRAVFSLVFGHLSESKPRICHHCDNRICVNPYHLYEGTAKDNRNHGEDHPNSVLTNELVKKIMSTSFRRSKTGRIRRGELKNLSNAIGIKIGTISNVLSGRDWKHVVEGKDVIENKS